jgi:hypothetical protein
VVQAAVDRQPWTLSRATNLAPDAPVNRAANFCSDSLRHFIPLPIANFRLPISLTANANLKSAIKNRKCYLPVLPGFSFSATPA